MSELSGLPVAGYRPQSKDAVATVNENKHLEETVLRQLDNLANLGDAIDQRWLAIGRTHIEQAFMAINRAVFRPSRIDITPVAAPVPVSGQTDLEEFIKAAKTARTAPPASAAPARRPWLDDIQAYKQRMRIAAQGEE